jgi:hypothetical protein
MHGRSSSLVRIKNSNNGPTVVEIQLPRSSIAWFSRTLRNLVAFNKGWGQTVEIFRVRFTIIACILPQWVILFEYRSISGSPLDVFATALADVTVIVRS